MKFIRKNLTTISLILICLISLSLAKRHRNFSKSCEKMKLMGSVFSAECKTKEGTWMLTSVELGYCVTNSNGSLKSGGGYQNSSRGCVLHRGNTLSCQSESMTGKWIQASINLDTIIGNNNGIFIGCGKATKSLIKKKHSAPIIKPAPKPYITGGKGSLPPMPTPTLKPAGKPIIPAPMNLAQVDAYAKGKAFCLGNCVINHAKKNKRCLVGSKLVPCKRCTGKPGSSDQNMKKVCESICNANLPNSPCDFYGYLNNKKKVYNAAILGKYGLSILKRFRR